MKEIVVVVFAGLLVLGVQVSLLGAVVPAAYKPDLMLATVVWSSLRLPFAAGASYAFVTGLLVSALSGSPTALFSLVYCVVFSLCWYLNVTFHVDRPSGWAMLILAGAWIGGAAILSARFAWEPAGLGWNLVGWMLTKSLVTVLAGECLMLVLERVSTGYSRLLS
jgi:hypothetical protein